MNARTRIAGWIVGCYGKGDLLIHKGEWGDWMGFINRGMCAVLSPDPQASQKPLAILKVGANFGEAGLFGAQRGASIIAITWVNVQVGPGGSRWVPREGREGGRARRLFRL